VSAARVPGRQTAAVPRTVRAVGTVAVGRKDGIGLRQRLALDARAALVDRALGDAVRLDHALVVAVGGVVAADVPAAGLLDDVRVGETGSALVLRVVGQAEEAFGDAGRSAATVAVRMYDGDQ